MNSLEMSFFNKTTSRKGNDIFFSEVFWLVTRAGKMSPSFPHGIARFDPAQTYKARNSWAMSVMKSKKLAERSQNKKKQKNEGLSRFCYTTNLVAFFPGSWNKTIILDSR